MIVTLPLMESNEPGDNVYASGVKPAKLLLNATLVKFNIPPQTL